MTGITINNCVYFVKPIYNLYAASEDGSFINIVKRVPNIGRKSNTGYLCCNIRKHGQRGSKSYQVH